MSRTIELFFDYISPYAYLASTQLPALCARHGAQLVATPVVFGALLASTGSRGPAEIPARREYLVHDITRLGRALGVPIQPPATHPFLSLPALRMTTAVAPERRWPLVEALFRATWVEAKRVHEPDVLTAIADELSLGGAQLAASAASDEVKAGLRQATDRAIARGCFGVPSIVVDDQLFWGVDSLPLLERFLGGEEALDAAELARWRKVVPSVTRRIPNG